jgi:4-alpha-glucanotransferase
VGATYLYPSSSDYFAMLPKEKILYFNSQFDGKLLSLTVERNTNNEFILNIYGAGKSPALLLRLHWDPKRREFLQTVAVVDRMDRRAPRLDTTTLPVPDTRLLKEKYTLDEAMQLTGLKHRNKGRAVLERLMERGAFTYHNGNITRDEMGLLLRIAGKLNNEEYLLRHLAYLILDLPEVTHEASDKNAGERNRIRSLIMNNPAIYIPGSPHFAETKQVSREDAFFIWAEKELVDRAEPFLPGPQASKIVGLQGPSISPFKSDMPQTADGRSVWIMVGREAYFREDALNAWVREVYKSNAPLPKEPTFLSKTLQREATRRSGDQGPALAKMEAMRLLGLSANQERNFARYFQATSDGKPLWIEKRGVRLYLKGNLEAWRREMLALSDREVATVFRNRHNAVRKMVMQICSAYQGPDRRAFLSFELLAALSLPGTVFLAATHPLAFWGMVLSLVMVGAVVAHNGFKKFESAEHLFHPEERHLTVPNGQGGFSIRPEFQALLGNIDENTISIKTFPLLPIVAAYVPHRAHRHSAWQMINKKSDCPLCGLLFNKEKHSIEVGDDFVVVPEEFPYLGETGTIVKIKHQEPQIDFDLVRSMLQTLYELGPFGFRVGYNHRGAGQKITHQSYRVFPQKMPIENAASTPFLEYQGVTIRRIVDFPIRGFIIEAHSFERLLDELYRVESLLELLNTPFNLLMTESNDGLIRVFVMLRTNADVPVREFDGKIFGMMEAAGMALFEKKDEFMMPDLEEKLKEAYQHVTPTAEDEEAIAYTYRAHAAVARYATAHNVDYEVDLGGNVFYVFTIDAINEVLKFFRLPSGFSGNRSYQWADFFVQGFRLVLSRLGAVYTPTKAVKITSDARIEAIRPGEEPEYIVQKMVPGESVHDQMNTLLSAQPIDADKVIALYEKYIDFHVRLISAGVFDYDVLKSQINVKGETDLIGFDISHLRSVRSGLNVFGPGGYAEEWEDLFVEHINEVSQRHPELAARLKERFRGFSWKNEFERAGRAIPATMDETQAVPMKEWTSELETAPETAAEKPSPKDTTVLLLNRLRNRGLGTKRRILGKAAHFVSPAIAGFRNVVGTYMPLFQMRSKSDWGVVSYKNMEMAVDYHAMTGQNVIQLPPIRPSSAGNSPYSVNSSKAIEDLYIGVDGWMNELVGRGIVIPGWGDFREGINDRIKALRDADTVDYDAVRQLKKEALQFIWAAFRNDTESSLYKEFERFQDENKDWLSDVMLYFTLKEKSIEDEKKAGVKWDELRTWDWRTWLPALRDREPAALAAAKTQFAEEILFRSYMQFIAHRQLRELLAHGRRRGVQFVADIPFAVDGEDIYANPAVFGLEKNATGKPYARKTTQGVGAESSFPLGQYWLFYPFDWMYRATLGFIIGMLEFTSRIASYIRYDHVLGFYRTYHYSVDPHQSLSLESGGIYDEVLALRNRVFAASNHQERLRIAGEAFALFQSVFTKRWKTLPKELQRLLADNAIPLAFDESGTLLPDNMIRIIRPMSEDEKKMGSASGPGWKYEKDVENLVYGGPLHVKFIRLSPAQETGDFNHEDPLEQYAPMLTYMSGEEIRPTDGIGLAYYELNPRAEEYLTEILRVSQARGLVSIWELLGNLPKAVLKSTIELGGFNFLPAIWGEKRFHGSSPNPFHVSNHVENALVTGSLHDSETLRNRWEVSLNNEDGLNAKTEWLNENLGASQWGENELRNFTPVVHEKLLETIYSSPARIAIVNWLDILNLSEDYRINTPGFLGQWTKRVPTDVTLEDLWGAARGFESASPRAVEATALLRRLIEKGHRKTAPPHQGEVKIQSTVPATGGPMIQIRRLEVSGHPYDVDAYTRSENNSPINGVNLVIHLKNGKTTVVPMSPVDIDPSSHAHGLPVPCLASWAASFLTSSSLER